jgi:hypothetical protein
VPSEVWLIDRYLLCFQFLGGYCDNLLDALNALWMGFQRNRRNFVPAISVLLIYHTFIFDKSEL